MKRLLVCLPLILPLLAFPQSAADDEITYRAALDWLDRKLNYYYYDDVAQKYWLNKFYVNEQKEVTIKNISTDRPLSSNIKEKVYLIRKFKIQDINPYNMDVRIIDKSQGRIAKGKLLELRTYSNEKKIEKTVDGRRATTTSFVHLSFPTFMTDSIADYAELVKSKLSEAIIASTKVYATGDIVKDRSTILKILQGTFLPKEGEGFEGTLRFRNVLSIHFNDQSDHYFGYDINERKFFLTKVDDQGIKTSYYQLLKGDKLILQNISNTSDFIEFETLNTVRMNNLNYYRM